jgi:hypothetical protein
MVSDWELTSAAFGRTVCWVGIDSDEGVEVKSLFVGNVGRGCVAYGDV